MKVTEKVFLRWLIVLTPFIDILNGIIDTLGIRIPVSVGQFIRILVLIVLFFVLMKESIRKGIIVFGMITLLLFRNLVITLHTGAGLFSNIVYDIRYIYVLVFVLVLKCACRRRYLQAKECIKWAQIAYLVVTYTILLCKLFSIGLDYAGANKGFFKEQNSLTALLVFGCSIWLYRAFIDHGKLFDKLNAVLICFVTLSQATKTGLVGVGCCLLYVVFYIGMVKKDRVKSVVLCILGLAAGGFVFLYFVEGGGNEVLSRWQYFMKKLDIVSFLLSGRNAALAISIDVWIRNIWYVLFGTSFVLGSKLVLGVNPALSFGGPEMDAFDVIYYYGILIGLIVLIPLVKQFIRSIKNVLSTKLYKSNYYNFSYIIFCVISFLGGHVLSSPMAGVFFAIAFVAAQDVYPENVQLIYSIGDEEEEIQLQ